MGISRRKLLSLIGLIGLGGMAFLSRILFKKNRVLNPVHAIIDPVKPNLKKIPAEGQTVSVETALNSRCSSDYDDDQKRFHWGMFDAINKLSGEQINNLVSLARIPRFTEQKVEIQAKKNILTYITSEPVSDISSQWAMVESGMQQQAVMLVSAALGTGMIFLNLGKDGRQVSENVFGAIKMKLAPMKPSYNREFWSTGTPAGETPWVKGNLSDPIRKGDRPLLTILAGLQKRNEGAASTTEDSISQLLWAARGRTPHLYKSRPWGMTIPTWAGNQKISAVYLIANGKSSSYINWTDNRPTHSLKDITSIKNQPYTDLLSQYKARNGLIVIAKNESHNRALWEVGYQLLNVLLQAKSLDLTYEAHLLTEAQKEGFSPTGIDDPVAVVSL